MDLKKNILITGGTGLIGKALSAELQRLGHLVAVLSRQTRQDKKSYRWDVEKGYLDPDAIEFADVIIHLAGENISSGRWTTTQKRLIQESRTRSGELLLQAIRKSKNPPKKVIGASAIGYYGSRTTDHIFTEKDAPGTDFLARTVIDWEKSTRAMSDAGVAVTLLRIGLVLSPEGGALPRMMAPVRLGMAAGLGSGQQWMPWISLEDLVRCFIFLTETDHPGEVFNGVAPEHVKNKDFMKKLSRALGKPFILPNVPSIALKVAMGEMATLVLEGSRVSSKKVRQSGFSFQHPELESCLSGMLQ